MKTYTHSQTGGFIALFFTLGISSILLAYVAVSSTAVFDFMRTREEFRTHRTDLETDVQSADRYVDMLVRTSFDQDIVNFSFISGSIRVTGTIHHGFISNISSSYISL